MPLVSPLDQSIMTPVTGGYCAAGRPIPRLRLAHHVRPHLLSAVGSVAYIVSSTPVIICLRTVCVHFVNWTPNKSEFTLWHTYNQRRGNQWMLWMLHVVESEWRKNYGIRNWLAGYYVFNDYSREIIRVKGATTFWQAGRKCQTKLLKEFLKTCARKLRGASVQIQSWMICYRRISSVKMIIADFVKFQLQEVVVKIYCYSCTSHPIHRRSFICVWRYLTSTRGSLTRSIRTYHH